MKSFKVFNYTRQPKELHLGHNAYVTIHGEQSKNIEIKQCVSQACIFSKTHFNMYFENAFKNSLRDKRSATIGGESIDNIRNEIVIFC